MVNKYLEKIAELTKEAGNAAKIADRIMSGSWGKKSKVFTNSLRSSPPMWYKKNFRNLVDNVASMDHLPRHLSGPDLRKRGKTLERVGKEMANIYKDRRESIREFPMFISEGMNANRNLQWMADRLKGRGRPRVPKRTS